MHSKKLYPVYFIFPAILIYFTLFLLPSFVGMYYSFTNWNSISLDLKFVGFQNFLDIAKDANNLRSFRNTVQYAVFTSLFKVLIGLFLALLLDEGVKSKNTLRTLFFLPIIVSNIIVGLMFQQVFHPETGLLNEFLRFLGLGVLARSWLVDPHWVLWSAISVEVWKASGFTMAIFLAGLQSVPRELYEACEIDGGGYGTRLLKITIPYIQPAILINTLLSIISGFKVFDVIFALTNGGPGRISEVVNITMYNSFSLGDYGYGTAIGTVMFVFLALVSIGIVKLFRKTEVDTG